MRRRNRWREKSDSAAELKPTSEIPAERCKQTHVPSAYTYINHIRDVMDVIFCHNCICCCQVQQIVIPGFCAFQLVLRVLGLPLGRRQDTEQMKGGKKKNVSAGKSNSGESLNVCSGSCSFGTIRQVEMAG